MSTESVPLQPTQSIESIPPDPTPEELFAEHVALVRREGDALDVQKSLKGQALAGVVIAAVGGLAFTTEKPGLTPVVAVGAAMLFSFMQRRKQKRGEVDAVNQRLEMSTQKATGNSYELYRLKDGSVAMHWLGTAEDTQDTAKALEDAALLANRHDIKRFCVDDRTLAHMRLLTVRRSLPGAYF